MIISLTHHETKFHSAFFSFPFPQARITRTLVVLKVTSLPPRYLSLATLIAQCSQKIDTFLVAVSTEYRHTCTPLLVYTLCIIYASIIAPVCRFDFDVYFDLLLNFAVYAPHFPTCFRLLSSLFYFRHIILVRNWIICRSWTDKLK